MSNPRPIVFHPFIGVLARVLPSFTQDGTWQTMEITGLLGSDTSTHVIIHAALPNVASRTLGCSKKGSTLGKSTISNLTCSDWVVPITWTDGVAEIDVLAEASANAVWTLNGEFRGNCMKSTFDTLRTYPNNGTWLTRSVASVDAADSGKIEAVIFLTSIAGTNAGLTIGHRGVGQTGWQRSILQSHFFWDIIPVDSNDQYEIYGAANAKNQNKLGLEVGYIRRGYGIKTQDIGSNTFAESGTNLVWSADDLSTEAPTSATVAFCFLWHDPADTGIAWKQDGVRKGLNFSGGNVVNVQGHAWICGVSPLAADNAIETFSQFSVAGSLKIGVPAYYDPTLEGGRGGNRLRDYTNFNQYRYT